MENKAIGVFDSGMGGLTVLKALAELLPNEDYIYLGDTARLPYGTKSSETVIQYAKQATYILKEREVKCLVVACNTASSVALDALREQFYPIPVVGVLLPGAEQAAKLSSTGVIGVVATEATINAGGYQKAIQTFRQDAKVLTKPCSLFVSLAEEGWGESDIAREVASIYLEALVAEPELDCLVLGCTHFPVLKNVIADVVGAEVQLVDSADSTAEVVRQMLTRQGWLSNRHDRGREIFFVTDLPERFARVAEFFLGRPIASQHIEPVKIDGNQSR